MKGNLKHFGPTQILNLVSLAKKTGTLSVSRRGTSADLAFKDGKLIFVSMGDVDGSLAAVLEKAGKINSNQAKSLANHAAKHGDKQLGLLLIQKGYISRSDIVQCIKRHALASVNEFAQWDEGKFDFDQGKLPSEDRILVPLDLESIIIQIVRIKKRDEALIDEIPSLDVPIRFTDKSKLKKPDLQLSKEEWSVLRYVRDENTIRMIANSLKMDDRRIRRVISSLREAGLIELVQVRTKREMTTEEKQETVSIAQRLIKHFQSMG